MPDNLPSLPGADDDRPLTIIKPEKPLEPEDVLPKALAEEVRRLRAENAAMKEKLSRGQCSFCGAIVETTTETIKAHVLVCPNHPLREAYKTMTVMGMVLAWYGRFVSEEEAMKATGLQNTDQLLERHAHFGNAAQKTIEEMEASGGQREGVSDLGTGLGTAEQPGS